MFGFKKKKPGMKTQGVHEGIRGGNERNPLETASETGVRIKWIPLNPMLFQREFLLCCVSSCQEQRDSLFSPSSLLLIRVISFRVVFSFCLRILPHPHPLVRVFTSCHTTQDLSACLSPLDVLLLLTKNENSLTRKTTGMTDLETKEWNDREQELERIIKVS